VKNSCHVSDQFCVAAANLEDDLIPNQICTCYRCGLPVCHMCSTRRLYPIPLVGDFRAIHICSGGAKRIRVRLCNNCQVEYDGNDRRVMRRLHRLAGYVR
jgi:hypothetical protein